MFPFATAHVPRLDGFFSTDGAEHQTQIYFDAQSDLVVNTSDEPVTWGRFLLDGQPVLRMGSREQAVLAKRGDDLRIDWGYLYLTADKADGVSSAGDFAPWVAVCHSIPAVNCRILDDLSESIVTPARRPPAMACWRRASTWEASERNQFRGT